MFLCLNNWFPVSRQNCFFAYCLSSTRSKKKTQEVQECVLLMILILKLAERNEQIYLGRFLSTIVQLIFRFYFISLNEKNYSRSVKEDNDFVQIIKKLLVLCYNNFIKWEIILDFHFHDTFKRHDWNLLHNIFQP